MDSYADDLATLMDTLNLKSAVLVGHSTGGGEVARYIGTHGSDRVAKTALIGSITPLMLQTPANPKGVPIDVFDGIRAKVMADRSQFFYDLSEGFYGGMASQGIRDSFWLQGMQASFKGAYDCIQAFSETDHTEDLKKFKIPTLILHGDADTIVPIDTTARETHKLIAGSTLTVYSGAPHGMCTTHKDRINKDLLSFLQS